MVLKFPPEQKIYYTLRVASAMCFLGHGSFGIIGKPVWCNYFAVFGIGRDVSFELMPFVGVIDILFGLIILFYPFRAAVMWLVVWGAITALLRPLSGEPFAEFIERVGNFGAPLALLILSGGFATNIKTLLTPIRSNVQPDSKTMVQLGTCLRIIIFLLFLGHGWLNLSGKQSLVKQYMLLGFANPLKTAQVVGILEIVGGLSVLIRLLKSIVILFFIWKVSSELFYPRYELFEWIERGGSYGVLLALWFALSKHIILRKKSEMIKTNTSLFNNHNLVAGILSNYNVYTKTFL